MVFLFIDVFVLFENIDISRKLGAVIGMINEGIVFCTIVSPTEVARGPIKPKLFTHLNQRKRKSTDLLFHWMMVLLMSPAAVEFSVWTGDGDYFQPISISVRRMGKFSLDVMYSAPSSASAAEDMTSLMIWEIVSIGPFHSGVGSFFDKNIWAPERLCALDSFLNPASEWAARIMSLAR